MGCTVTPTNLVFGDVSSAILANTTSATTATISYDCTGAAHNSTIRVCLELDYYNASNTRSMTSGANTLTYQIYKDASHTQVWGNSTDGNVATVDLLTDSTGAVSSSSTMYGQVLAGQTTALAGSYSHSMPGSSDNRLTVAGNTTNPCTSITSGSKNIALTNTATISANCNISTTAMNFGSTSVLSSNIDSTATITAKCINSTPYSIGLGSGLNASGSQRRMQLGATANYVNYGLYTDSGRSSSWLATTSTTSCTGGASTCALGTGTGSNQNVTVFGRVPSQTVPIIGVFSDTVVVTITY